MDRLDRARADLGRQRGHENEPMTEIKLKAPPTTEKLRRLILRRTDDMAVANAVGHIAETIDAIARKLAFDNSPQTVAEALNDLINMITKADRMLGASLFKTRMLTSQQINQLLAGRYAVEAPGFAEYIYINIMKARKKLSDVEAEPDVVALLGELADLTIELQCALIGYGGGGMIYGRKIRPMCK